MTDPDLDGEDQITARSASADAVFAANESMRGSYYGWDGPCPPWNDENLHHYRFAVYALNVKMLNLPAGFDGPAVLTAIRDKVLGEGLLDTVYSTNPATGASFAKEQLTQ